MRYRVRWVDHTSKERTIGVRLRREAQAFADQIQTSQTTGLYRDPAKAQAPFSEALERHLAALSGEVKKDTLREYRRIADYRLFPTWGHWSLSLMHLSEVQAWIGSLRAEGLGDSSLRNYGLLMRAALETAVKDHHMAENPLKHLGWMPTGADQGFTSVMGRCGLRPSEAMALQAKSVDFEQSQITVSRRYTERGGPFTRTPPKNGKRRTKRNQVDRTFKL